MGLIKRRSFFEVIAAGFAGSAGAVGITTLSAAPALGGPDEGALLKFYFGDQWPADVKAARVKQGRPCLTVNRLPEIVGMRCAAERQSTGEKVSEGRLTEMILDVTRRCMDPQRLYNYYLSAAVEASIDAGRAQVNLLDPLAQYGETPRITRDMLAHFDRVHEDCLKWARLADPLGLAL